MTLLDPYLSLLGAAGSFLSICGCYISVSVPKRTSAFLPREVVQLVLTRSCSNPSRIGGGYYLVVRVGTANALKKMITYLVELEFFVDKVEDFTTSNFLDFFAILAF